MINKIPPFSDIAHLKENDRIDLIGKTIIEAPNDGDEPPVIAFIVENEEKADRYIRKLEKKFPGIRVIKRIKNCPTPGLISVKVGIKLQ